MARKLITCKKCGKKKPHHAKNLCHSCYELNRTKPLIICKSCGLKKPHHAKGLCHSCYLKQLKSKIIICSACGELKPHAALGLCVSCYECKNRENEYKKQTHVILNQHYTDHINDPNSLTIEFMQNIIGSNCKEE